MTDRIVKVIKDEHIKTNSLLKSTSNKKKLFSSLNHSNHSVKDKMNQKEKNNPYFAVFSNALENPSFGKQYIKRNYNHLYNKYYDNLSNKIDTNLDTARIKIGESILSIKSNKSSDVMNYKIDKNDKLANLSKLKLKLSTIKWLLENKKENIDRLVKSTQRLLYISNEKVSKY